MRSLPIPPDATTAKQAVEVFRGWLIDGKLQCSLLPSVFSEPRVWGMLLADVAHHVANALADSQNLDRTQVLAQITGAFAREMRLPTDQHQGGFVDPEAGPGPS